MIDIRKTSDLNGETFMVIENSVQGCGETERLLRLQINCRHDETIFWNSTCRDSSHEHVSFSLGDDREKLTRSPECHVNVFGAKKKR